MGSFIFLKLTHHLARAIINFGAVNFLGCSSIQACKQKLLKTLDYRGYERCVSLSVLILKLFFHRTGVKSSLTREVTVKNPTTNVLVRSNKTEALSDYRIRLYLRCC